MLIFARRVFIRTASGTACFSRMACLTMTGLGKVEGELLREKAWENT